MNTEICKMCEADWAINYAWKSLAGEKGFLTGAQTLDFLSQKHLILFLREITEVEFETWKKVQYFGET